MKVKWGILGVANIAKTLIKAIQESEQGEIIAISSRSLEKAKKCAQEYNIPKYYGSYQELLEDSEITAIYIPLPNHLHKEWSIQAAKYHKHILCEKPFVLTPKEAQEVFDECKKEKVKIMEAFMYRFDPKIERIKQLIQEKGVGTTKFLDFNFSHTLEQIFKDRNDYRLKKEYGGGALYDLGVYGINSVNYLLDATPEKVIYCKNIKMGENDIDRAIFLQLKYPDDVIVTITASFQFNSNYLHVAGTSGEMEITNIISQGEGNLRITKQSSDEVYNEKLSANDSYRTMINHFDECILNRNDLLVTEEQTMRTMKVVEMIQQKTK